MTEKLEVYVYSFDVMKKLKVWRIILELNTAIVNTLTLTSENTTLKTLHIAMLPLPILLVHAPPVFRSPATSADRDDGQWSYASKNLQAKAHVVQNHGRASRYTVGCTVP